MAEKAHYQEETNYKELYDQAMELWNEYSLEYRTIREDYLTKLNEKRALKITPVQRISAHVMSSFPYIKFLSLNDQLSASQYLLSKTDSELKSLIAEIRAYKNNVARVELLDRIANFKRQINQVKTYGRNYKQYCPGLGPISPLRKSSIHK